MDLDVSVWKIFLVATCIKFLLLPAYRSTDFEVHRNWLAITHSLPLKSWYYEDTSQWTLDYPPFFAYFEYLLSWPARLFDPAMLEVKNLDYASPATVLYQRLTVILADVVLALGVYAHCRKCTSPAEKTGVAALILLNCGLFIVDHIHFQYNGFLFGFLLLATAGIAQNHVLLGSAAFAALLNFKHIYLYVAPAFFVYILRRYCLDSSGSLLSLKFTQLILIGGVVCAVFGAALGPFLLMNQLPQLLSRLFPFKRGLCHAYWAPNFWALYNMADKALIVVFQQLKWPYKRVESAALTGGLVTDAPSHAVLPTVPPLATFLLTLLAMLPALYFLWRRPSTTQFILGISQCGMCSFMFGWHVHEKAILLVLIPLSLIAVQNKDTARTYALLHAAGTYALLPLLIDIRETPLKLALFVASLVLVYGLVQRLCGGTVSLVEKLYLAGFLPLQLLASFWPYIPNLRRFEFMPLLLTSVYTALGVSAAWLRLYRHMAVEGAGATVRPSPSSATKKKK